jgi:hypothetical protein
VEEEVVWLFGCVYVEAKEKRGNMVVGGGAIGGGA